MRIYRQKTAAKENTAVRVKGLTHMQKDRKRCLIEVLGPDVEGKMFPTFRRPGHGIHVFPIENWFLFLRQVELHVRGEQKASLSEEKCVMSRPRLVFCMWEVDSIQTHD